MKSLLLPVVSGMCLTLAAGDHLLLDDCEKGTHWTCDSARIFKTSDAAGGKSAVGIKIEKPSDVELKFDLKKTGVDLSEYDLIAFDYKLSGPVDYLDFIIKQYPLNAGRLGHYYPIDQADPRGRWATKILPLRGPENLSIHLSDFDPQAAVLKFKFQVRPGTEPAVLLVDNLRVMKNNMAISPITFGQWFREKSGAVRWQYSIPVKNISDKTINVKIVPVKGCLKKFKLGAVPRQIYVKPGTTGYVNTSITIPAGMKLPVYYGEELTVNIGKKGTMFPTRLIAAVPPESFTHPSLLGSLDQLKSVPSRIKGNKQLENIWKNVLKSADMAVNQPLSIPDYNGAGPTQCSVDKTKLRPIKRPGLQLTEYVCDKCGRVYHGKLYDSGFSGAGGWYGAHMKLCNDLLNCALAYRVTGIEKYGKRAADIMRGYTKKYLTYDMEFPNDPYFPLGPESPSSRRICGWHFMENRWLQFSAMAYDLMLNTGFMSGDECKAFKERVLRPAVQKTTENEVGLNNIQLPHSMAQLCAGFALEDPVMIYYGSRQARGIISNIEHNINADGTWGESPNYNSYVAGLLPPCLYLLKKVGCDPYTEKLLKFYYRPVQMANPGGKQPNFGDGPGCDVSGWGTHALLPYYQTKNPELKKIIERYRPRPPRGLNSLLLLMTADDSVEPGSKSKEKIKRESILFPDLGFLFLNNEPNDLWFAMVYGSHIGHGHYDRLGFELYGGGALQSIDDGSGPYDQYHDEFDIKSLAHNTIVVDMKNQNAGAGKLLKWQPQGEVKIASIASSQLYNGVTLTRTAIMFPEAVLLLDRAESDKPHIYDWTYHNMGAIVAAPVMKETPPLAKQGMYTYLKNLKKVDLPMQAVTVEFRQRKLKGEKADSGLLLTRLPVEGTTLYSANTGHGYKRRYDCATLFFRNRTKAFYCVTLLEPLKPGAKPVYSVAREGETIVVSNANNIWNINNLKVVKVK